MVPPVIAAVVEPLDEPVASQLRVAQLVIRAHLFCSASLGLYFFGLEFLQTFSKRSKGFVLQHPLLLHFLQDFLRFQIQLKFFKGFQKLLLNNLHFEMAPLEIRFLL